MIILDKLTFFVYNIRDIFNWPILQIGTLKSYKEVRTILFHKVTNVYHGLQFFR